jgi:hypothetical protein
MTFFMSLFYISANVITKSKLSIFKDILVNTEDLISLNVSILNCIVYINPLMSVR